MFLYFKVLYRVKYYNLHSKREKDFTTWSPFLPVPYRESVVCEAHIPLEFSLGRNNLNVGN